MNPETPAGPQPPAPTPSPFQAPPAPQPPAPAGPPVQPANGATAHSGKKGLIIGLIAGVVLLLGAAAAAWFLWLTPAAQAERVSNSFMKAITAGNGDDAAKLANVAEGGESFEDFIKNSASKVEGGYKLSEKTFKDNTGYYLYELSGSDNKYARTIVEKADGKWLVESFVFSSSKLALVPGDSNQEPTDDDGEEEDSAVTPVSTCVLDGDLDTIYSTLVGSPNPSDVDYGYNSIHTFSDVFFFKPDSLEFAFPVSDSDRAQAFADFYMQNSNKKFTIHLTGSVATSAQADLDFANQRAQKIRDQLVALGVPSSIIVIDEPDNINDIVIDPGGEHAKELARQVEISIVPDTNCTP